MRIRTTPVKAGTTCSKIKRWTIACLGGVSRPRDGRRSLSFLPTLWKGIGKPPGRVKVMLDHARPLLDQNIRADPGSHNVAGTIADVARQVCEEGALGELAQIHAFATSELPKRPGQGLSEVADDSNPATCKPKPSRQPHKKKPTP